MANQDQGQEAPLRDNRSFSHQPVNLDDEIAEHHKEKWQHQAMYVGLHFSNPDKKKHRKHHHRHSKKREDRKEAEPEPTKPLTPPSQRVQFLLGENQDDEDEDHKTHDIFCEMDELRPVDDEGKVEWKETARWIKFEEDVEEGGERWSKPHVATLSLHSLFELRKGIMSGSVMLDLQAGTLPDVTELVCENMVASKQLDPEHKDRVIDVLLSRHRHQHEKHHNHDKPKGLPIIRSLAEIGKKSSEKKLEKEGVKHSHSGSHLSPGNKTQSVPATMSKRGSSHLLNPDGSEISETPSTHKFNEHFLKKIPPGAEASNILVGEVDFLDHPIIAFVRLQKSVLLGDLTEVPVPTRFIFVLLGPTGNQARYHEIGRSIATLMSDEIFHDVAYHAKNRGDLLAGIDEFLDQVTVLPPGEWDPTIRIEPPKSVPSQEGRKTGGTSNAGLPNGMIHDDEHEEDHSDPTLVRTGRFFGGLIGDIRRKAPWYASDFKDALHVQCIASFFFMYFACLTPIITFGGLLGSATDRNMAAIESILAGAVCGVTYHLASGQPLTIIGSTGPVLVFETIVYNFCFDQGWNYLTFRFWIGIWVCLILLIMVAFDLSALVRYITRFTEESFAALIALIFIVEAFKKLFHILDHYAVYTGEPGAYIDYNCTCIPPSSDSNVTTMAPLPNATDTDKWAHLDKKHCKDEGGTPFGSGCDTPHYVADVFFWSVLLFLFTFVLAYFLKNFKTKRFFPNMVRGLISDFAVMIAIVSMVGCDLGLGLQTPKLDVPEDFRPTRDDRGWFINPLKNPLWTIPAAIAPALLATILIFMDQQITAVIVNRKENLLKKGSGYHLDLCVIAIQIGLCSVMGLPWFVAATVLSINHVRSLTKESESSAPGERPKFLGVREQRVTGVLVFLMVGLSVLMVSVLRNIPMPVLYGVFLFMGVSSLNGVQLMQRISIVFMPPKYQPDYIFLRHVPLRRVYLFTAIQVVCLAVLWVIKTIKQISIVFPLMVLAMCFVRKALDWVFTRHELKWLDDIMPESHKREKEEKKKQLEEMTKGDPGESEAFLKPKDEEEAAPKYDSQGKVIEMTGGAVNIPLKGGKSINIAVDRITYDPAKNQVNISEEMSKTAIWKQLAANESDPQLSQQLRQRKAPADGSDVDVSVGDKSKAANAPVRFTIAEDDETPECPQIVVDPPSKA